MWVDRGAYYEFTAPQKSQEWLNARIGRVNGSNTGALAGKSSFKTPEQIGKIIAGVEIEHFEEKNIIAMTHGNLTENSARRWYEETYNCKVIERGLAVPKSDYRIGGSIDGEIVGTNSLLEIKCPKSMYKPILSYMDAKSHGWIPPANYYNHIFESHMAQMQQCMFVLQKTSCEYIIFATDDAKVFTQTIPFLPEYWKEHYSVISENYEKYVKPYLVNTPYPLEPNVNIS